MPAATEDDVSDVLYKQDLWPSLRYVPHRGQALIHNDEGRHKVASCGRRFGKSTLGGHELTCEALATFPMRNQLRDDGKRREFWIVGPEYSDSEKEFRILWNDLQRLEVPFDKPGSYNNPESGDLHVSLWNGTFEVHAKSAKYPQTLVGEGLSGVIMAEAAKLKQIVWTKYIRPTLADFRGWSLHTSTPEGKNWFYDNWKRGQNPAEPAWSSWRMPSWINDQVFPLGFKDPEIQDMKGDMSAERFLQEVAADFTDFVGRVFKHFEEETHVRDIPYDPRYPVFGCCDYGWTNPFVWLFVQVDTFGNVYVLDEIRRVRMDINDIARDIAAHPLTSQVRKFYPDPAAPGDTAVLEKRLRLTSDSSTGGEQKWRLELIRQALKLMPEHGPEEMKQPRLLFDRKCHDLIREMLDYRYPDTKDEQKASAPERPMDKDDHGPEALGRFFRGYFGAPGQEESGSAGPRVRKATVR